MFKIIKNCDINDKNAIKPVIKKKERLSHPNLTLQWNFDHRWVVTLPSRGRAEPSLPSKRSQLPTNPPQEGSQVTWLDDLSHYCLINRRAAVPKWTIKIRSTERAKSPTCEEQELGHNRSWWRRRWRWRWCGRDSHSVHISIWWRVGKITLFAHVEGRFWENAPKSNLSLIVVAERVLSHLFKRFSSAGTNRAGRELELVGKIPQEQIWWSQHWWAWFSF